MGRAMLIIVTGLMVTMGYTFMGMSDQKSTITSQNVSSANKAMANNMAHTGIQLAINEMNENSSWDENHTLSENINGTSIEYYWEEGADPNLIKITAIATNDKTNTADEIVATVRKGETIDLSLIPGAMGVYGENSQVTINGDPPNIDGRDYDMDATTPNGDTEGYKAGAAGVNSEDETFNTNTDGDLLTGDPAYEQDPDLDGQFIQDDLENKYLPNAETFNGSNLGTIDNPNIVTVEGTNDKIESNGAGILIVRPGATLSLGGSYKFYGLIIVQGTLKLKGTPQVYGSVLFTDNSTVDVEDADGDVEDPDGEYAGTPDIRYSSQALATVSENLQTGGTEGLVSIYD